MDESEKIEKFRKLHQDGEADKVHKTFGGKYIGDMVYGANDGIITTFAVVSAVMGASLHPFVVLIVGFANLLADGFSMAASDYLAVKSEHDYREKQKELEKWEVDNIPEEQEEEVRHIYRKKGFTGNVLEKIVSHITGDKGRWVETLMLEQLHLPPDDDVSPIKKSCATFLAFVVAGFMPLLPFAFNLEPHLGAPNFLISIILTAITMFAVGAARTLVTARGWVRSGIEMLLVGTLAAGVAYLIGWLLKGLSQVGMAQTI